MRRWWTLIRRRSCCLKTDLQTMTMAKAATCQARMGQQVSVPTS